MSEDRVQVPPSDSVITVPPEAPSALLRGDDGIMAVAREADARVAALERVIKAALKITSEWDWVTMKGQDERVYLTGSGAEKVARLFGIRWSNMRRERLERSDSLGEYYMWITTADFTMGRDTIPEVGTCTSRDPFFAKREGKYIPSADVDEPSILKASVTNCVVRGVTGLIGLRNLPKSFLPANLQGKVPEVTYMTGTQGAGGEKPSGEATDKARQIGIWLLEMSGGEAQAAMDELEQLTTWVKEGADGKKETVRGKRDVKRLSEGQVKFLYDKIGKSYLQWKQQEAQRMGGDASPASPPAPQPAQGQGKGQNGSRDPEIPFGR